MHRVVFALFVTVLLSGPIYADVVSAVAEIYAMEWQSSVKKWKITWIASAGEVGDSHTHYEIGIMGYLETKTVGCGTSGSLWSTAHQFDTAQWSTARGVSKTMVYYDGVSGNGYRVRANPGHYPDPTANLTIGNQSYCPCDTRRKDDDEDGYFDDDEAGYERDCDDDNPDVNPGANEICGNGDDDDCDGTTDQVSCAPEEEAPPGCDCKFSPIILQLSPGLIKLTNPENGVWFDLNGDGITDKVAWTEQGDETDAFLALDHNTNGIIDNGSELLGNASICGGRRSFKNGFEVLRYVDTPGMGGNFDGVIDDEDAIFQHLLLWVDRNHNGLSEPAELLKFSDHFQAIEWSYKESRRRDRYGNLFRWRGFSYSIDGKQRLVWDVILRHQ